jgi:photosystem I subunit 9
LHLRPTKGAGAAYEASFIGCSRRFSRLCALREPISLAAVNLPIQWVAANFVDCLLPIKEAPVDRKPFCFHFFFMKDFTTYLSTAPVVSFLYFGFLAGLLIEINRFFPDALVFPFLG